MYRFHRFLCAVIFAGASLLGFAAPHTAAANVKPSIWGTPATSVAQGTAYRFAPASRDLDGDPLRFSIANKPSWATFSTSTGVLSGTPGSGTAGTYSNIIIYVSDGSLTGRTPAFSITVTTSSTSTSNTKPSIWGTPPASVVQGTAYRFAPSVRDPDGDPLTFSIANKPNWATFSSATGILSGTPGAGTAGTYSNIIIYVSDGRLTGRTPAFSISVTGSTSNTPPTITGTPPTSVQQGNLYSFTPTARDANGDRLSFSIANRPAWAVFDTATGKLSGTPRAADLGTYSNITIRVTDGKATTSLPAFAIAVRGTTSTGSATLSWTPPARNTDGTPLTNLSGYKIYWGTASRTYTKSVTVNNPGIASYVVDNLTSGTYFFAVSALDSQGGESAKSSEASKTIP